MTAPAPDSRLYAPLGAPLGMSQDTGGATAGQRIRDALGTDILLTANNLQTSAGDFVEVSGIDNLQRAIWRRLATRPGEYRVRPSYGVGLPDFVKKPMTSSRLSQLKHAIVDNLGRDPRIKRPFLVELDRLELPAVGLRITITATVQGLELKFLPFIFVRET